MQPSRRSFTKKPTTKKSKTYTYQDFALPLNPYKTIAGRKYRVMGIRDTEKGGEAVLWFNNRRYLAKKPGQSAFISKGTWTKPQLIS